MCAGVMPRAVQCGLLGVMKAVSSPAQPAGGHTTLQKTLCRQFLQTTPQTNQFGSQMCGQLISVIRCTYNFLLPLSSYTLFRVVNFRCADMRLLFFPVQTIKAVFRCNIIYRQLCHCPVSVYSRLVQVQSFASLVFGSAVMSCLLSCLLW